MNITIITCVLPYPLDSGGAQAQFNMIDSLRKKHSITIIFTEDGRNRISAMHALEKVWPEVSFRPFRYLKQMCYPRFLADKAVRAFKLMFMPSSERFQVERALKPHGVYFSADFKRFINKVVAKSKPDIVQVEFFPCLPAVECLPKNVRKVFVHHEIRFVRNRRLLKDIIETEKEKKQEREVKEREIALLNRYDAVITLTDVDRLTLRDNGVNIPLYVSQAAVNAQVLPYKGWNGNIVFIGGHGHIPNKEGIDWFTSSVRPRMATAATFYIIGSGWPKYYENANTRLTGFVESLKDAAYGAIMIVPILTGSGMRMKILEAAAMGIPFVTTTVGVEGLDFKDKESCLVADTPEDFAKAVDALAADGELRRRLAENASSIFIDKYSVAALSKVREAIYYEITAGQDNKTI